MTGTDGAIEIPAAEIYALAVRLGEQAEMVGEVSGRLTGLPALTGVLRPAVADLLVCERTAAHAFAGELHWLGSTIAAVADSWLHLDGSLLAPRGRATPR